MEGKLAGRASTEVVPQRGGRHPQSLQNAAVPLQNAAVGRRRECRTPRLGVTLGGRRWRGSVSVKRRVSSVGVAAGTGTEGRAREAGVRKDKCCDAHTADAVASLSGCAASSLLDYSGDEELCVQPADVATRCNV